MTILSHVCVDFTDKSGRSVFTVTPNLIDCVLTAPDEIQEDPIFDMLLGDHSLEAVRSVAQRRQLENDPAAGVTAEGKKPKAARKDAAKAADGDGDSAGKAG